MGPTGAVEEMRQPDPEGGGAGVVRPWGAACA
ncbi:MAG: hypothetical protein RJB12_282, partial [Pseudomonadota bacterium]